MTDRDGRVQWGGELPAEVIEEIRRLSKERGVPQWKLISEAARERYGLDEVSSEATHQRHVDRLEDEIESLLEERDLLEQRLEEKQEKKEFHETRLAEIRSTKVSYEERMDDVLDDLEADANLRVTAFRSKIQEMATDRYGSPTPQNRDEVLEDLWERAVNQHRDVREYQFEENMPGGPASSRNPAAADGKGGDELPASVKKYETAADQEADD